MFEEKHILILGDSSNAMKDIIPDNSVSLVVTSPPYFTMRGEMSWLNIETYMKKMKEVFKEVYRVLERGGVACVNVSDYTEQGIRYPLGAMFTNMLIDDLGYKYSCTIIWKKQEGLRSKSGHMAGNFIIFKNPCYLYRLDDIIEYIIVVTKGHRRADIFPGNIKSFRYSDKEMKELQTYLTNVWEFTPQNQFNRYHASAFPKELPYRCIKLFTIPGQTVLDPFAGSGTTGVVAKELNRSSIQVELNPKYIYIIKKRMKWGTNKFHKVLYEYYDRR